MSSSPTSRALRVPAAWSLTRGEESVFGALLGEDTATPAVIAKAANVTPASAGVLMSRLRKKIAPHRVEIETVSGKGWRLIGRETWRTALAALTPIGDPHGN